MATKTYKLVDLFRSFYVLYIADRKRGPYPKEEADLVVLTNILSSQLAIANSDEMPEDIPVPVQDFFQRFLEMLYFDRKAVRYVCEKVIQFQTDKTSVDPEDKILHSHLRKIINQLSDDETIEIENEDLKGKIQLFPQKIIVRFKAPYNLIFNIWRFLKERIPQAKNTAYSIGDGLSVTVDGDDVDRLYSLLDKYAKENNLAIESHSNEKLTFAELNEDDKFISFPMPGDNSGHGGFLGSHWLFKKMKPYATGENAIRKYDNRPVEFRDNSQVLKIE